jgi:alpha-tubulin suppressor-like RCC1 family protein
MSGFTNTLDGDLNRVFFTEFELVDQFYGARMWGFGANSSGRLGDGSSTSRNSPVTTTGGGINWKQVAVGDAHTAGIKTDGTLWLWGAGAYGQLGDNFTSNRSSPVTTIIGGTNWKQIACGTSSTTPWSAAVKTDGTLWTWGSNSILQLGDGGTSTGSKSSPSTTFGAGNTWKQVACGATHGAAVKIDGSLFSWGSNGSGQLGSNVATASSSNSPVAPSGTNTGWKQVACGADHTAAVKYDGALWCWGSNGSGRIGNNSTTNTSSPVTVSGGITKWNYVACGPTHTAAITTDGILYTWGDNTSGKLGEGSTTARSSPGTIVGGGTDWKIVAGGLTHTLAVKTDGTLWSWGDNTNGKLGDGTTTAKSTPALATAGLTVSWKSIGGGGNNSEAVGSLK